MNEKLKKAFEQIKKDEKLMEKFSKLQTLEEIATLAKENNFDITLEDLNNAIKNSKNASEDYKDINGKTKLDLDELEKVVGGDCVCVFGGGGKAGKYVCACPLAGVALHKCLSCGCSVFGFGKEYHDSY